MFCDHVRIIFYKILFLEAWQLLVALASKEVSIVSKTRSCFVLQSIHQYVALLVVPGGKFCVNQSVSIFIFYYERITLTFPLDTSLQSTTVPTEQHPFGKSCLSPTNISNLYHYLIRYGLPQILPQLVCIPTIFTPFSYIFYLHYYWTL